MNQAKQIQDQTDWGQVAAELSLEKLKLASYDQTLIALSGDLGGKKCLDYGCGPGILLEALESKGASVRGFDISPEMRSLCSQRVAPENVYASLDEIPRGVFDLVICSLVVCIVDEAEVRNIAHNIHSLLAPAGNAYVGFCNPHIFDLPDSQLDKGIYFTPPYTAGGRTVRDFVVFKLEKENQL